MINTYFRFYAELSHFLPSHRRDRAFSHNILGKASIKDTIESLGVPHTEVDRILVNDKKVDFSYILQNGDNCHIYPVSLQQNQPIYPVRFILDVHLGKLANQLRMLGFDTLYRNDYADEELADISSQENRILLTRDLGVLKRGIVNLGYYVRATNPEKQLTEVMQRFNLFNLINPFARCIHCNGLLAPVAKENIIDKLPQKVQENYQQFSQCPDCNQIFWQGTHFEKMQQFIDNLITNQTITN